MPKDPELAEVIRSAGIVLLHREVAKHGQVVLTTRDFAAAEAAEAAGQVLRLRAGPSDSVIFTHDKREEGRPVS